MNNVTAERVDVDEGRVPAEGQRARICELSLHSDSICVRFDDDEITTKILNFDDDFNSNPKRT